VQSRLDQEKALLSLLFDRAVIQAAKRDLVYDTRLPLLAVMAVVALVLTVLLRLLVFNQTRWKKVALLGDGQRTVDLREVSGLPLEMVPIYTALNTEVRARHLDNLAIREALADLESSTDGTLAETAAAIREIQQLAEQLGNETSKHKT
jgi:hypothetical protein